MNKRLKVIAALIVVLVIAVSYLVMTYIQDYPKEGQVERLGELTVLLHGMKMERADLVIVLLHGARGQGSGFASMAQSIKPHEKTCLVLPNGPFKRGEDQFFWFRKRDDYKPSREKVIDLLTLIRSKNPSATIVMGGFSQGAIMSSNFIGKDAELLDGLILFSPSGAIVEKFTAETSPKIPVFLSHGRTDEVLPFDNCARLQKQLSDSGFEVTWFPYDEGHIVSREAMAEAAKFLSKQFM